MTVRNYQDLVAWQKAMDLVEGIYNATARFPKEEVHGLTSQLRRAAILIPSNIAEGQGRQSDREFHKFLLISHGSLREVETQILIAERLGYLHQQAVSHLFALTAEVGRLINGLLNMLSKRA